MKYYVYISDQKVDMLLSQISTDQMKRIATEFKLDLKVISASKKTEVDSNQNRIQRLEAVASFIRKGGSVGSVDEPNEYFVGEMPLRWGPYSSFGSDEQQSLVYFGGATDDTIIGLGGSSHHVIGNSGESAAYSASATPYLVSYLCRELDLSTDGQWGREAGRPIDDVELRAVHLASTGMSGAEQRLEFMAKRLLHGSSPYPSRDPKPGLSVLLGTPLYVAMAE